MPLLTKAEILSAADLPTEDVPVPEWGGTVRVKTLTAGELAAFQDQFANGTRSIRVVRERLAAATIVDESGNRVFSDDDVAALSAKSGAALDRVFAAASKLNAITGRDVEQLAKN